jgi:hypothetical protein
VGVNKEDKDQVNKGDQKENKKKKIPNIEGESTWKQERAFFVLKNSDANSPPYIEQRATQIEGKI